MRTPVLIPAYQPSGALTALVADLRRLGFSRLVIVDDGSSPAHQPVFDSLPAVHLLRHPVNQGKGAALKTGLDFILAHYPDSPGAVTADADGQHAPEDILAVAQALESAPNALILGARSFSGEVPLRSRLGNRLTATLVKTLAGAALSDTQTGLRGIPNALAARLLRLPANGYEFELDMLLAARHDRVDIREIPIRTIYLENNASSHFNPLWDSMRVYFVLLRFSLASLGTALLDNAVFAAVFSLHHHIAAAQLTARLAAMAFNYWAARRAVFQTSAPHAAVLPRYVALVAVNGLLSYALIRYLHDSFAAPVIPVKIAAEAALFLLNFLLQRDFVFRRQPASTSTDWTRYYSSVPPTARLTRAYSSNVLVAMFRRAGVSPALHWIEPGGANSCFFDRIQSEFQPALYEVIDTNQTGLDLLAARTANAPIRLLRESILEPPAEPRADVVYSVGLVEHFDPPATALALENHFRLAQPGAIVLVTFPTPTWLYRASRAFLEAIHMWAFPDERPLTLAEVLPTIRRHAEVLETRILWPMLLTQAVVVARKTKTGGGDVPNISASA